MDDFWGVICLGSWFVFNIFLLVWAYRDAESRGQSGCLVGALIYFAGLPGILIWLLVRDSLVSRR
ncbi:MAG: hypothetical protein JXA21_15170 [Anaerolineae bacterium]|nr:hypothetical protein [Anaerolineae bacterium]